MAPSAPAEIPYEDHELVPAGDWRGWDRATLDREYSPSSRAPDFAFTLAEYGRRSAQVRDEHPWRTVRYGDDPAEAVDFSGSSSCSRPPGACWKR